MRVRLCSSFNKKLNRNKQSCSINLSQIVINQAKARHRVVVVVMETKNNTQVIHPQHPSPNQVAKF